MSESSKYILADVDGTPMVISADYTPTSFEAWYCLWFARCTRYAVKLISHPTAGDVPICGECAAIVERARS